MYLAPLIFAIVYYLAAPITLSYVSGHALALLVSLTQLHKLSSKLVFWLVFIFTNLFSAHSRLSLEYLLIISSMLMIADSKSWLKLKFTKQITVLILCFSALWLADNLRHVYYERGSLVVWLPLFLALYLNQPLFKAKVSDQQVAANQADAKNETVLQKWSLFKIGEGFFKSAAKFLPQFRHIINFIAAILSVINNKKTTLIAFGAHLYLNYKNKFITGLLLISLPAAFFVKDSLARFWKVSMEARLYVYQAVFNGILAKPLTGHGFGTFTLDFPKYRLHAGAFGTHASEQVGHAHNLWLHFAFELGMLGLVLMLALSYLVFKLEKKALVPFLVITLFDMPLSGFNHYALLGLILAPLIYQKLYLAAGLGENSDVANLKSESDFRDVKVAADSSYSANLKSEASFNTSQKLASDSNSSELNNKVYIRNTVGVTEKQLSSTANRDPILKYLFYDISHWGWHLRFALKLSLYIIALYIFIPSLIGHFYYDAGKLNQALRWDSQQPLYYFARASRDLESAPARALTDLRHAVKLAPSVPYFHGFLAAAELKAGTLIAAARHSKLALKLGGRDSYWLLLHGISLQALDKKSQADFYLKKAFKKDIHLKDVLANPKLGSYKFIGSKKADPRIASFYRQGDKVYLPLPYIEH